MPNPPHHTGKVQLWGDRNGEALTIFPKNLSIFFGNKPEYWKLPEEDHGPAELIQTAWLEVLGGAIVEKNKKYIVEFEVEVKQNGIGWNDTKVQVMAWAGKKGRNILKEVVLSPGQQRTIPTEASGALEIEMRNQDLLYFGLREVQSGKWKSGLVIKQAMIRVR